MEIKNSKNETIYFLLLSSNQLEYKLGNTIFTIQGFIFDY